MDIIGGGGDVVGYLATEVDDYARILVSAVKTPHSSFHRTMVENAKKRVEMFGQRQFEENFLIKLTEIA